MRRIAHISDLHFGREDPAAAEGLLRDLYAVKPDLVVNSGDFTQRARRRQFAAAAAYSARLPRPQLAVPGNHDIPLYDVTRRFLSPLGRYRRYITPDLAPTFIDEEIAVAGINTARSMTWKNGRISLEQIETLERFLAGAPADRFKIVVTHHPFIPPPGDEGTGVALVGRAVKALEIIDRYGVDLLLAGHLHHGYTGDVRAFYPSTRRSVIVAQAGTAISHRVRHEPNGYNLIDLAEKHVVIEVRRWNGASFVPKDRIGYVLEGRQWILQDGA